MRFLVDECTGPAVANWLRGQHYEVFSVFEEASGSDDDSIIKKAFSENWIIITNDKDFGEKVYKEQYPYKGIILMRLSDERTANKIAVLQRLLENYRDKIVENFVVVTEKRVRFDEQK